MGGGWESKKTIDYIFSGGSYVTEKRKLKKNRKPLLSLQKTSEYKYKVYNTLNKVKKDVVYYANDNTKPTWNGKSFLVPKVIFTQGSGMEMAIIDSKGEYLMTQHAYGIASNKWEELEDILMAIQSKAFKAFTKSLSSSCEMNCQFFKYLKKDFYLYFKNMKGKK